MGSVDGGVHAFGGGDGNFICGRTGAANDAVRTTPMRSQFVSDVLGDFDVIARGIDMGRFEDRVSVALVTNIGRGEGGLFVNVVENADTIFNADGRVGKVVDVNFDNAGLVAVESLMGGHTDGAVVLNVVGIEGVF